MALFAVRNLLSLAAYQLPAKNRFLRFAFGMTSYIDALGRLTHGVVEIPAFQDIETKPPTHLDRTPE